MQDLARSIRSLGTVLMTVSILAGAATMLSACNTTAGLGQDVSNTGHAVTNGAERVQQKM